LRKFRRRNYSESGHDGWQLRSDCNRSYREHHYEHSGQRYSSVVALSKNRRGARLEISFQPRFFAESLDILTAGAPLAPNFLFACK